MKTLRYYKNGQGTYYISSTPIDNLEEITEEQYQQYITPTAEDERKMKEEELAKLMQELYPEQAASMLNKE